MEDSKFEESITDDRPILVSQQEIEERRYIMAITSGSFAVDNLPINPDTQHIFKDYEEGRIATIKEVEALLYAHYTKVFLKDS